MMNVKAFIFARGGSKGLPNKNILQISGKPLLAHSILMAQSIPHVSDVFVSTDSSQIADIAIDYDAKVIRRPLELASDTSPEWLSWQHAIKYVAQTDTNFDCFLSLPTTSPLRNQKDVLECLSAFQPGVDVVMSMTAARRSPWFNMVSMDRSQKITLLSGSNLSSISRRQDTPECFDLTTVAYVARPDFIMANTTFWDGVVVGVKIPPERALDIDSYYDYRVAKLIMEDSLQNGSGTDS